MNTDKIEVPPAPPFHMVRLGQLVEQFQNASANFIHAMAHGGGINNLGMLDIIRDLERVYLKVEAALMASRSIVHGKGTVSLDDGLAALEIARMQLEQQAQNTEGANTTEQDEGE